MNSLLLDTALPNLAEFKVSEVAEAIDTSLAEVKNTTQEILKNYNISWDSIAKLEIADEKVSQVFSTISHMNAVCNTKDLREAYEYAVSELTKFYTQQGQDEKLYQFYKEVYALESLSASQKQALKKSLVSFERSGVNLDYDKRKQVLEVSQELSQLSSSFENNIMDATMSFLYETDDIDELSGLSENVISAAITKAQEKSSKKKYALGLDAPTYLAVMQQADNRDLREKFYEYYSTRASDKFINPEYNNDAVMEKILSLEIKKVNLLGFKNYAEYSLDTKMAQSPEQVLEMSDRLLQKSLPTAKKDIQELIEYAAKDGISLETWDVAYYSEKLKKDKFDFTEEELREYFPIEKVLSGLFLILKKIYSLKIVENTDYKKYDKEVKTYEFYNSDGYVGSIICDFFARDNKRGGAWMDSSRTLLFKNNQKQYPVAYVNCNFAPPVNNLANITHNDVVTLFHEFGHALHHILSDVDIPSISGTNGVEWDAIELPSQFMENFCWVDEGLALMSGTRDGKELTKDKIDKLVGTRHFHSAMMMVRQLEFGIFDMNIYTKNISKIADVQKELDDVRAKTSLLKVPTYNKFQNGFSHIFAGGYSAGYYSYKWAEVLSSDVFSRFEQEGLLSAEVGNDLLENIISKGSSRDAIDNFKAFMGREPNEEALLRHSGIDA